MPSVSAIARGNHDSNGGFSGNETTYDLILAISVPLYDRGARYTQRHEDEARLQQSLATLASSRVQAKAAWQGAVENLVAAQARANLDIRRAEVAAAEGRLYGDAAM
ncbi:MAG: hypothetical protein E6J65_07135 [Deltaproteobacteria bacterium]|nr:MAG: hypothetical protein E6J65_07135 [Deltaproteobacteria bacterium]